MGCNVEYICLCVCAGLVLLMRLVANVTHVMQLQVQSLHLAAFIRLVFTLESYQVVNNHLFLASIESLFVLNQCCNCSAQSFKVSFKFMGIFHSFPTN